MSQNECINCGSEITVDNPGTRTCPGCGILLCQACDMDEGTYCYDCEDENEEDDNEIPIKEQPMKERVWHKRPELPTEDGSYWVNLEKEPGHCRYFFYEVAHGWYRKDNKDDRGKTYEAWGLNPRNKALVETFGEPRYWTPVLPGDIPEAPYL